MFKYNDHSTIYQDWEPVYIVGEQPPDNTNNQLEIQVKKTRERAVTSLIAKSISSARNYNNMSRKQLSEKTDIPIDTIKNYENGIGMIDEKHIKKLSSVLNVQLIDKYVNSPALKKMKEIENKNIGEIV